MHVISIHPPLEAVDAAGTIDLPINAIDSHDEGESFIALSETCRKVLPLRRCHTGIKR